jgi:hypothetical protein
VVELAGRPRSAVPEEDQELFDWIPEGFDPGAFDPQRVAFDEPEERRALLLDPGYAGGLSAFTPGRFDRHSLAEQTIEGVWSETAELGPKSALKVYNEVDKRQPHLLAFVLDETEALSEQARGLAHFAFVAIFRMFWKVGAKSIRKIARARIEEAARSSRSPKVAWSTTMPTSRSPTWRATSPVSRSSTSSSRTCCPTTGPTRPRMTSATRTAKRCSRCCGWSSSCSTPSSGGRPRAARRRAQRATGGVVRGPTTGSPPRASWRSASWASRWAWTSCR